MKSDSASPAQAVRPVTMIEAPRLSDHLGVDVVLASETFQCTGSFKFRAAYHTARNVPHPMILTASSGNFGQAIALACQMLGKRCRVVMPRQSAAVKIEAVREFGGEVDLIDVARISRQERVRELAAQHPDAYVASAYDDPLVITGNATLGRELATMSNSFDAILAPVGGGGLTAGILTGLRAAGDPTPVMAVEPAAANDAARSFREGRLVANPAEPDTLADGVRTLSLGQNNWAILRHELKDVMEVSEDAIARAVRLLFLKANLKSEPTGALAIAALLEHPELFRGQRVCGVISGGNVDPALFARLIS